MYNSIPPLPMTADEAREQYKIFLADLPRFEFALKRVLLEWPISCEQFLSNQHINRIAWLGQSSMCIETRVPACFRSGFRLLSVKQQEAANQMAFKYLNIWRRQNESVITMNISEDKDIESLVADNSMGTISRINYYISTWKKQGYQEDIPDEVPTELMRNLLAPSYKAIVGAILKNDMSLKSLGFSQRQSKYYGILKRIEIEARPKPVESQLSLF